MTGRITPKEEINLKEEIDIRIDKREELKRVIVDLQELIEALQELSIVIVNTSSPQFKGDLKEVADKYINQISNRVEAVHRIIWGL